MLHCPATLYVARHGDAAYPRPQLLTDDGGWLTAKGREQVRECAEGLRPRRITRIFSSTMDRAVESASVAAGVLDVGAAQEAGLREVGSGALAGTPLKDNELWAIQDAWVAGDLSVRVPGGESGKQVLERFRAALQAIADLHRGEQVLVFTHGGVMSFALPRVAAAPPAIVARHYLPNAVPAVVEIGDDGWNLTSWPGQADPAAV